MIIRAIPVSVLQFSSPAITSGTGQAPEWPRHIRGLLPLLRSRPGGVRSRAIARLPEPDKRILDFGLRMSWVVSPEFAKSQIIH